MTQWTPVLSSGYKIQGFQFIRSSFYSFSSSCKLIREGELLKRGASYRSRVVAQATIGRCGEFAMNPHVLTKVIVATESLAAFLHRTNMGLLIRVNTSDVTLKVFAAVEAFATAFHGASKRPGTLADPSWGNCSRLSRNSPTSTLLCQIRDWHGSSVPTRPGHSDIAAARNLDIEVAMRRRTHRGNASRVARKRLRGDNRRKGQLDRSRGVG